MIGLVLGLVIAIFIAAFASVNSTPVSINLFFWQAPEVSLALVVLISVLVGVILAAVLGLSKNLANLGKKKEPEIKEVKDETTQEQAPPQD
jgi:uncharacterized integral membrane protein